LVVKEATVGEGPTIKRIMARARGSASGILKRTSHIRIVLSDEIPIETRARRKAKQKAEEKAAKTDERGERAAAASAKKSKPKEKKAVSKK